MLRLSTGERNTKLSDQEWLWFLLASLVIDSDHYYGIFGYFNTQLYGMNSLWSDWYVTFEPDQTHTILAGRMHTLQMLWVKINLYTTLIYLSINPQLWLFHISYHCSLVRHVMCDIRSNWYLFQQWGQWHIFSMTNQDAKVNIGPRMHKDMTNQPLLYTNTIKLHSVCVVYLSASPMCPR